MNYEFVKEVLTALGVIALGIKMWIDNRKAEKSRKEIAEHLKEKEQKELAEKSKIEEKKSVEFTEELNRIVTHENKKIRDRYQAVRVYIIHFTNGTVTEANLHLVKLSFKHEVVVDWLDHRIEALSKDWQEAHMPDMFLSPMRQVMTTGKYYLRDREKLNQNEVNSRAFYFWLKAHKIMSTRWLAIRNGKRRVVAVLVSDWPASTDLDDTIKAHIDDIRRNIEGIYKDKLE